MAKKDYEQIGKNIIELIGGAANVSGVTHCATRLRFVVKDKSIVDNDKMNSTRGVVGTQWVGEQFQIIIGNDVSYLYDAICKAGNFEKQEAVDENLDKKLTVKGVLSSIMDYISTSIVSMLPVLSVAGLVKTINTVFGPDMLGVMTAESNLYQIFDILYEGCYYFAPIYIGFAAAKKLKIAPVLGAMIGGILLAPTLNTILSSGAEFNIYGFKVISTTYGQSFFPVMLSVAAYAFFYKLVDRFMPKMLSSIFTPLLSLMITLPFMLCLLAPFGTILGNYVGGFLTWIGDHTGFIGLAIIAAAMNWIIMTGMHAVFITTAIITFMTTGQDGGLFIACACANIATCGMALGAMLRAKNNEDRSEYLSHFISGTIGGVTEPALFGVGMKFKSPLIAMTVGAAAGGLYAGITHVRAFAIGTSNVWGMIIPLIGGGTANIVNGCIAIVISLVVGTVFTYYLLGKKD